MAGLPWAPVVAVVTTAAWSLAGWAEAASAGRSGFWLAWRSIATNPSAAAVAETMPMTASVASLASIQDTPPILARHQGVFRPVEGIMTQGWFATDESSET